MHMYRSYISWIHMGAYAIFINIRAYVMDKCVCVHMYMRMYLAALRPAGARFPAGWSSLRPALYSGMS